MISNEITKEKKRKAKKGGEVERGEKRGEWRRRVITVDVTMT